MAKSPPDFTKLFFKSLGGPPKPISYPLRNGPCLLHDLAFLSSLLHDARLLNPNSKPSRGKLALQLHRDCWELVPIRKAKRLKLHTAHSTLTCQGVRQLTWHLPPTTPAEPWINHLWIDDAYRTDNDFHLYLKGHTWSCALLLNHEKWSVTLQDQEIPQLR
jgi:hypothetical protein